ncbi:hypothetical protein [Bradyrhizobium sp. STM 3843]|uniref:hypothetical protein n=1 Tax=Bradyrhizobium sp. STM 3843 TaxID=551947 RepID=UPI001586F247|nr:hypothetical protein [Bradyrhizobium sp. STM 3843]
MRVFAVVLLGLLLCSCGLVVQQQHREQMAAATAAKDQATATCRAQFPDENKDFVARNKCLYEAAKIMRPYVPYPDLFDKSWATVAVIAEELDAKKITRAQADLQIAQTNSEIMSEAQRRELGNRSVVAQESAAAAQESAAAAAQSQATAAWMAPRSVTCNRMGNTTTCF